MKHVVIDARESGTTTGRYVDKLIEYTHRLKPEYKITLLAKPARMDFLRSIAPDFEVVASPFKEFTFAEQLGLLKQIKQLGAGLVFFPMVQQPVLYRGGVVTCMQDLTTLRFRNPSKNWLIFTLKRQVYGWVNKYVAKKSRLLITPTDFVKNDVVKYCRVDPSKITVTYESADEITDAPQPIASLEGKQFIMYLGRPSPHKNLPRLIEAFERLQQDHPKLLLVLAGKKDVLYEKIEAMAKKKGIKNVIFTGFVTEGELRWLYENTAVYVFPSLSEGFGLPGLEAMAHGAPVASSNATCLPEVYKDAALYFDPLDPEDMANKINQITSDKQLASSLIKKGRALIKTYSWSKMATQTLQVFDQALKNR